MDNPQNENKSHLINEFLKLSNICNILSDEIQLQRWIRYCISHGILGDKALKIEQSKIKINKSLQDLETAYRLATADWWRRSNKLIEQCKLYQK